MNLRNYAVLPLLASLLTVAACNRGGDESRQGLAESVGASIVERMAEESIKLGSNRSGIPAAEITPAGDLLVGGEKVPIDAAQRALVMDYRAQLAKLAQSGAKVGLEGAEMAGTAMTELAKAALSGDMDKAEKNIEAQAESIEASARLLCDQVPLLIETERRLAAAVPQFAPYATLDEKDGKDCDDKVVRR